PDPLRPVVRLARLRRLCALGLGVVAVFDLVTAVLPPSRHQLTFLLSFAPLVVAQVAAVLVALCGLVLLALTRGVRRGQRRAWSIACVLLSVAAVGHLARGVDAVQCALGLGLLAVLVVKRDAFVAATDHPARRSGALLLIGGAVATIALTMASVEAFLAIDRDGRHLLPLHLALLGVAERMVGVQTVTLPRQLNEFLSPTLLGVGLALAVFAVLVVTRPLVDRRQRASATSYDEARRVLDAHGGGTLDYFALRYDKAHHFSGETLITYAVHAGVCVVSPDPIGPADARAEAWAEFLRFADSHGWLVAVLGADESWLPVYRAGGMKAIYIGDEAVVTVADFDLAGGHKKGLRQAVNRIARYGYTLSFHDPRHLDAPTEAAIEELMEGSRRGERERGFSMTLGRLFDPDDTDLLLAVASDRDGTPVAFCQFVPAASIEGYSLDLMRRDQGEHPNGLIDFIIVGTIEHLHERGMRALGLNFAAMRAILAGEAADLRGSRLLRFLFTKLSSSMQIESLWRFNAKFDPAWVRRYLVFGSVEHLLTVGLAVARAESIWEVPVIGRFLYPGRQSLLGRVLREHERRAA
ncbi:MAG: bifunctional lysylphosphatidylglycerol flippase/synthetase MprF, partial [Acidimicrobiales bacterium]